MPVINDSFIVATDISNATARQAFETWMTETLKPPAQKRTESVYRAKLSQWKQVEEKLLEVLKAGGGEAYVWSRRFKDGKCDFLEYRMTKNSS